MKGTRHAAVMWWGALAAFALRAGPACGGLPTEVEACLECHREETSELTLSSGETRSLFVDGDRYARSVHGEKLLCTDCHTDIEGFPHPERTFNNLREFTLAYYESCKRCHFDNYTKTLDSAHYAVLAKGDRSAPLCVDCHGAHDVNKPGAPKARISNTCAKCHAAVYDRYAESVHGTALLRGESEDVPVCTDCHRSHNIEDPRTASFALKTPDLCAGCHTNEALMRRYGLPSEVLKTYLADFHGMTASFYRAQAAAPAALTAVCTDCHGVHDIFRVSDQRSSAMKANLAKVCRKCHEGATENFPDAWLSHYEPSPDRAPLVYYVKVFYAYFIPFVVLGLALQILLHIWRVAVSR